MGTAPEHAIPETPPRCVVLACATQRTASVDTSMATAPATRAMLPSSVVRAHAEAHRSCVFLRTMAVEPMQIVLPHNTANSPRSPARRKSSTVLGCQQTRRTIRMFSRTAHATSKRAASLASLLCVIRRTISADLWMAMGHVLRVKAATAQRYAEAAFVAQLASVLQQPPATSMQIVQRTVVGATSRPKPANRKLLRVATCQSTRAIPRATQVRRQRSTASATRLQRRLSACLACAIRSTTNAASRTAILAPQVKMRSAG